MRGRQWHLNPGQVDTTVTLKPDQPTARGRMIMPRLAFEEPKGGPLAKAAQQAAQEEPEPAEQLEELFTDEEQDARPRRQPSRDTVLVIHRRW
jgi:hypothetical protein